MYYLYSAETSEIYAKSETEPESGLYCVSDTDYDLTLYRVIVGAVSEDKQLTYYTTKARPAEQLAQQIINMRQTQLDTDTAALDLDYRLTLIENGVKEGEI